MKYLTILWNSELFRILLVVAVIVLIFCLVVIASTFYHPDEGLKKRPGIYYVTSEGKEFWGDHLKEQSILYDENNKPVIMLKGGTK